MIKRNALLILLVLLMLVPGIVACSPAESGEESRKIDTSNTPSEDEDENKFPYSGDFKGETVTIYTMSKERNTYGEMQFVYDDEIKSNVVNEAVKVRNDYIYNTFNVKIEVKAAVSPHADLKELINADAADFQIVCNQVDQMALIGTEGYFYPLEYITNINLDDPWWDQRSVDGLSLDGENHFFAASDGILCDDEQIYMMVYNKDMYSTYVSNAHGDIYQTVRDEKFTFDEYNEMCKLVTKPDSDGNYTTKATYGNLNHTYGSTIMFNAAGIPLAKRDEDNVIRVKVEDQTAYEVFDKIYTMFKDPQISLIAEQIPASEREADDTWGHATNKKVFTEGRGLFLNTTVATITEFMQLEEQLSFNVGVVPMPKYSTDQDGYYCAVNRYHSAVLGVPVNVKEKDFEKVALVLNALGYYNTKMSELDNGGTSVRDAYFDVTLKLQGSDKDDDADMLDIIFASKMYDLGSIFTWGNLLTLYTSTVNDTSGTNKHTSNWESMKENVLAAIDETIKNYNSALEKLSK